MRLRLIITLILVISSIWIYWRRQTTKNPPVIETLHLQHVDPTQEQKIRMIYQEPRKAIVVPNEISAACKELWGSINQANLKDAQSLSLKNISQNECHDVPLELNEIHKQFMDNCRTIDEKNLQACQVFLFLYRAAVTHYLTKELSLSQIDDPKVLVDKLTATMNSNPAFSAQAAERLLELDPKMYPAAKAALFGYFLNAQREAKENPGHGAWEKVSDSLKRAQEMGVEDPNQIAEIELTSAMLKNQDPQSTKDFSERYSLAHPESGLGPYYKAWAEIRMGDKQSALEGLREALRREPGNSRYQETLTKIEKGESEPFKTEFSFSFPEQYIH